MLLLMERFRQYVADGRTLHVPEIVEMNLAEQKEHNNPFDTWLTENLEVTSGTKFHYHRFEKAYNATLERGKGKISPNTVVNQLKTRGFVINTANERDAACCRQNRRCVQGANVKDWETLNLTM